MERRFSLNRKNEFKWSAGRPRPAVSDVDGRDARRSIMGFHFALDLLLVYEACDYGG